MSSDNPLLVKVVKGLKYSDISTIPAMLGRLLKVSRDPNSHAADLAAVCEMDKATSARLLRAANSVYFATENRDRVDNLRDAIVRIGFETAEEIILSSSVSAVMKSNKTYGDYSTSGLWRHSVAVAIASRLLFQHCFGASSFMDPFIAGLLHDLGISLEHQFLFDEGFQTVLVNRQQNKSCLQDEEMAVFGFSHEQLGEAVANKWNFPAHLTAVIRHHHDGNVKDANISRLVHTVRMAESLCFQQQQGYSDFSETHAEHLAHSRETLGLDEITLEFISSTLEQEMTNLSNLGWFSEMRLRTM